MSFLPNRHDESRPWGSEHIFTVNEPSTVKILHVNAGKRLSLQKHAHRSEYWKVIAGSGIVQTGTDERQVQVDDEIEVPVEEEHRITGGDNGISILEISEGTFDEKDIVRIEDDYGRA
jgi:mannose-6-phosphate isomerase-like protein (cupin superfamily)